MNLQLFQIDAFTSEVFRGNPAAVAPLEAWLPDQTLQAIALENNLSETAYIVPTPDADADYHLRWFTPGLEADLCGHATLATAHVLWNHLGHADPSLAFSTEKSGELRVMREGEHIVLDFPASPLVPLEIDEELVRMLGKAPVEAYQGGSKRLAVFEHEREVIELTPDFRALAALDGGMIATAPGSEHDFVSRYFASYAGVDEDPVTGSAHCVLTPYWSRRLGRAELSACQISKRGGLLRCVDRGDRIHIAGRAATYLVGTITIPG